MPEVIDFFARIPKDKVQMKCVFCYTERVDEVSKNLLEVYHGNCPGCDEEATVIVARMNKSHQWCMIHNRLNSSCYVRSLAHLY